MQPSATHVLNGARDTLHRAVEKLPEREREVLRLRYGLDGEEEPKSLEEIGRLLHKPSSWPGI